MEIRTPRFRSSAWYSTEQYWLPRSTARQGIFAEIAREGLWWTRPGCGLRAARARHRASTDGPRFSRSLVAQPTTRREKRSMNETLSAIGPRTMVECQVEPTLSSPDVGDVSAPLSVGGFRREVLCNMVGRDRPGMFTVGRPLEPALLSGHQLVLFHQAGCSMPPDLVSLIDEIAVHAGTAVGPVRQRKGRSDVGKMDHVLPLAMTGRTIPPGEEPALADSENPAHPLDREAGLLRLYESEAHRLASFAKKAFDHCPRTNGGKWSHPFLRYRAPASEPRSRGATASARRAGRPMPRPAHQRPVHD